MRPLVVMLGGMIWLGGCGPTPTIVPNKPVIASAAAQPNAWRTNLMPTEGVTVDMPGVGEERSTNTDLTTNRQLLYHRLEFAGTSPDVRYEAGVYSATDRSNRSTTSQLLDDVRATVPKIESQKKVTIPGFDGVSIAGTTESGRAVLLRAYLVGEHVYVLRVEAASANEAEDDAERFFESFRLDVPFRIFVSSTDHFLIARPMPARFSTSTSKLTKAGNVVMTTYLFSYDENDAFSMNAVPTENNTNDPDVVEEMLDNAAEALGKQEGNVIDRLAATTIDGAAGRDVSVTSSNGMFTRAFIVVKNQRIYVATRTVKRKELLVDKDSLKFFGSFTLGRAP